MAGYAAASKFWREPGNERTAHRHTALPTRRTDEVPRELISEIENWKKSFTTDTRSKGRIQA